MRIPGALLIREFVMMPIGPVVRVSAATLKGSFSTVVLVSFIWN